MVAESAVQAAGQPPHHVVEPGQPYDAEDVVVRRVEGRVRDVLAECALQYVGVLVHEGDARAALPAVQGRRGAAVEADGPVVGVVEARDQGEECALAGARAADESDEAVVRHGEGGPAQDRPSRDVGEVEVGHFERGSRGAACAGGPVAGLLRGLLGEGEDFVDPQVGARAALDQTDGAEHRRQRHDQVRGVQQEGDQVSERVRSPAADPHAADDQDEQEGTLDRQFDGAAHDRGELRRPYARPVRRVNLLADAVRLAFLGAVHADHRQGAEGAFQFGGDGAHGGLHLLRRHPHALEERGDDGRGEGHRSPRPGAAAAGRATASAAAPRRRRGSR